MDEQIENQNDHLVLVGGDSGTGKSASVRGIPRDEQPNWIYFNAEAGKKLPFANSFNEVRVDDPIDVLDQMDDIIENQDQVKGVIFDTFDFMMERYVTKHIKTATNGMKAWGEYGDFIRTLYQEKFTKLTCPTLILAHNKSELDEALGMYRIQVPIQGAVGKSGLEAFHSIVLTTRKVPVKELLALNNPLLEITEDEKEDGYKHVFQTRSSKGTVMDRIRAPIGLFARNELYIDNDAYKLFGRLTEYYKG